MVERIIVTDGDWSQDNVRFAPRQALPFPVGTLPEGEYHLTNTRTRDTPYEIAGQELTVVTNPTLSGSTQVGGTLTRQSGTALGAQDRATEYLLDGTIIDGATAGTLSTVGFDEGDEILTRDKWTTVINGETVTAYGTSNTVTLTVQPTLQGTISGPLVAGQPASITFNTAPDTVTGSITLTRVGTTNQWAFTVPLDDTANVTIGASKAGWDSSGQTYDVLPPLPVIDDQDNQLVIQHLTVASDPETVEVIAPARHAGVYAVDPALLADGPLWLDDPVVSRAGGVLTMQPGLPVWLTAQEPVAREAQWRRGATPQTAVVIAGADAMTYQIAPDLDGGANLYGVEIMTDAQGHERIAISNGIAVDASSGWWQTHAGLVADVDFANNRARINGVTYATIAAARTANAIKTLAGVDYIDITTGTAGALAASGTVLRDATTDQYLAMLDDGADGEANDNVFGFSLTTTHNIYINVIRNGTGQTSVVPSGTLATGAQIGVGMAIRTGAEQGYWRLNALTGVDNSTLIPVATRLCLGARSFDGKPWLGAKKRIVYIAAALTNADLDALVGAIQ